MTSSTTDLSRRAVMTAAAGVASLGHGLIKSQPNAN